MASLLSFFSPLFKDPWQSGRQMFVVSSMASTSLTGAPRKRRISTDSDESELQFLNDGCSTDTEDDSDSSDFSTDSESASNCPDTSASIRRVSTTFGQDHLTPAAQRVEFSPRRRSGVDLDLTLWSATQRYLHVRAVDIFMLFFTTEVIREICNYTNKYAGTHIFEKPSYSERDGSWSEVTEEEMRKFIGLLVYMGIVQVPRLRCYWSERHIFSGILLPSVMPWKRFKALLAFLSVSDPEKTVASHGNLHRMTSLLQHMNNSFALHFQPCQNLSVEERTVKFKGRAGIQKYMRDKVVKRGYKTWVLADSERGYTLHFDVHTGRHESPSVRGLAIDEVTRLCGNYLDQGYIIFFYNFYTSTSLFVHLLERKTLACGRTQTDRRGFPSVLKDGQWAKNARRGDVRWLREDGVLYLQWKDKHVVNMMSTAHTANEFVLANQRKKIGNQWTELSVKKPMLIDEYNKGMPRADTSDQLIASNNVLMKSVWWWKTPFFHCVDIAVVNSFILFEEYRQQHPEVPELLRSSHFDQYAFRLELIDQLLGRDEQQVARSTIAPVVSLASTAPQGLKHQPQRIHRYRNCKVCYEEKKHEQKTNVFCETCAVSLCFTTSRNCFARWHDKH
ncbi:piggyBac transposable element-derived protein 2 [Rhipicephalus sanguineus]|uniref:piggyBac transposable element-derived protein 2 n=1 Tax=Rhipicephalus sanguineus TaxID=34632 RepID=UPI0018958129|nr:piggyBac transposable element-derived protein 2 [Rhipicephalus sanguineus]